MKPGTLVRMNQRCKDALLASGSEEHLEEFGECVGEVLGEINWGSGVFGPEVDVLWQPDNLKYSYHPDYLEIIIEQVILLGEKD